MRELDKAEINLVTGAAGPGGAVVGAIGGATAYYGDSIASGEGSWRGMAQATLYGAITGFVLGPAANIGTWSVLTGVVGFYGGLATGGISSLIDSYLH